MSPTLITVQARACPQAPGKLIIGSYQFHFPKPVLNYKAINSVGLLTNNENVWTLDIAMEQEGLTYIFVSYVTWPYDRNLHIALYSPVCVFINMTLNFNFV